QVQVLCEHAEVRLAPDLELALFRVVQEALTNVAKHARATRVKVALAQHRGELRVTVTDDGQGIQPAHGKNDGHGFGVLGMTERAAALGGELTVQPAKRRGTQVSLRIPLSATPP
ncbi:MAG: sensor histidine kinase, partial [Gammaproteobacteria bacterium]